MSESPEPEAEHNPKDVVDHGRRYQLALAERRGTPPVFSSPEEINYFYECMLTVDPEIPLNLSLTNHSCTSKKLLSKLNSTHFQNLLLEVPREGFYVIVRLIVPLIKLQKSLMGIIEDEQGRVINITIYNYIPLEFEFEVGTVFAIKEPYIKGSPSGGTLLRVDSPTDIIIMYPSSKLQNKISTTIEWHTIICNAPKDKLLGDPKPQNALQWKVRGNELYGEKNFVLAREAYFLGLQAGQLTDEIKKVLRLNISAAHFELGYYEKTVAICEKVMRKFPRDRKALLRAGKANYKLRNFTDANRYFKILRDHYPEDEEGKVELEKVTNRLLEMNKGDYNMDILGEIVSRNEEKIEKVDCADYLGPVKLVNIRGKGRGLVTTKKVKSGTLLIASKALYAEMPCQGPHMYYFNYDTNKVTYNDRLNMVPNVAELIYKNPNTFAPMVYNLLASQGVFQQVKEFCDARIKDEPICNIDIIGNICTINGLPINMMDYDQRMRTTGIGLFYWPSFINHSCDPNVRVNFFNDLVFIHARRNLRSGEEVLMDYAQSLEAHDEMNKRFLQQLRIEKRHIEEYIPNFQKAKRKDFLKERGVTCECARCSASNA